MRIWHKRLFICSKLMIKCSMIKRNWTIVWRICNNCWRSKKKWERKTIIKEEKEGPLGSYRIHLIIWLWWLLWLQTIIDRVLEIILKLRINSSLKINICKPLRTRILLEWLLVEAAGEENLTPSILLIPPKSKLK